MTATEDDIQSESKQEEKYIRSDKLAGLFFICH